MFILLKSSTNPKKLSQYKTNEKDPDIAANIIAGKLFKDTKLTKTIIFCIKNNKKSYYYKANKTKNAINIVPYTQYIKGGTIDSKSTTKFSDLPEDLLTYIPFDIKSMNSMSKINKTLYKSVKNSNENPFSLNIPGSNNIMQQYDLKMKDIINGSFTTEFLDDFIYTFNMLSESLQENHLYKMFHHTRKTKKILQQSTEQEIYIAVESRICTSCNIFKINEKTDANRDFRIIQFLLYLSNIHLKGKVKKIMTVSLLYQMLKCFEEIYKKHLHSVIGRNFDNDSGYIENNNLLLDYLCNYIQDDNIAPVHLLDINFYNIYSVFVTAGWWSEAFTADEYRKIYKYLLLKMTSLKSLHKNADLQMKTLLFIMDFWINRHDNDNLYIFILLFQYINNLIENNLTSSDIFKHKNYINTCITKIQESLATIEFDDNRPVEEQTYIKEAKDLVKKVLPKHLPFFENLKEKL
jgi:hypothetical protein